MENEENKLSEELPREENPLPDIIFEDLRYSQYLIAIDFHH